MTINHLIMTFHHLIMTIHYTAIHYLIDLCLPSGMACPLLTAGGKRFTKAKSLTTNPKDLMKRSYNGNEQIQLGKIGINCKQPHVKALGQLCPGVRFLRQLL